MGFLIWILLAFGVGLIGKNSKIGFGWSLFWSLLLSPLIGLIIVAASGEPQIHHYKIHIDKGDKEEYKENYEKAIDHYLDALYHLENDYKLQNNSTDKKRQNLINSLKSKVELLKEKAISES